MAGTIIEHCNCKHEFQDKQYGVGNRVFNQTAKGIRCTACGKEKMDSKKAETKGKGR